ncbi:reverse transcriptase [Gossypium australe]|uniref:Reverse transcriptase n=1 Tax=Gossypium australe TaxID=47621 RepID=A0A5B6WFA9_9ROSI|nr:reverse transcriptase [Gossypium australe]
MEFFKELFTTKGATNPENVLVGIEESITEEENSKLLSPFREEEIWRALKGMGPTKAPDQTDSQHCSFKKINTTDIVLIPKVSQPSTLVNFRPISLCSVIYKIIAKSIANILQEVIGNCIDEVQSDFVPGRLISDNVLLAYEILHTFRQKRTGKKGYMAVKLDMSKAYDRVEWDFVKEVMLKMGFARKWVDLIMKCITTASYTVITNGRRGNCFQPTGGLRQGDPLSPFLFLICSEGLSALMRIAKKKGQIRGAKASRRGPEISHLLFADDCILFN